MMKGLHVIVLLLYCLFIATSQAQNTTQRQARTDPIEVTALNSVLRQWGISSNTSKTTWNISGEPCSGEAINTSDFEAPDNNPGIMCDCTYDNNSTCHITRLRVFALNVQGEIPIEITNLTYLKFLKIDQNYLTGPLPAFLSNLSDLWLLSVAINALSGSIPVELAQLKKLEVLSFGSNNFTGRLPPQLGSLPVLRELYLASAGLTGEIPSTFVNLTALQVICLDDNAFTGKIPDFFGNLTKLKTAKFQGNFLEGPIPSSFSKLVSLEDLRIGDLYNVSSSLEFVRNLRNITILILRNNLISGSIPSVIGEFQNLQRLDLSYNNLTGQIPNSIFNLSLLSIVFLGNNSLSGTIPPQKSSSLRVVDLTHNRLSGGLPAWSRENSLQLNLVANNLTLGSSDNSVLARGLNCLQGEFPCNRNPPIYSSFAINCGGPEKQSSDGTIFEADNSTIGASSYNVTSTRRWAVSNAGVFSDSTGNSYIQTNQAQTTNTLDSELFQTARLSPGSLRYYGLGLENGPYNVNLQFSETVIPDESARTWESLGIRLFNIAVQGRVFERDFDIRKLAGGNINRAVARNYKVNVTKNVLEINLFWAGKGTCQRRDCGPSISAIKVTPDFTPTVSNRPPSTSSSKNKTGMIVGIVVSILVVVFICAFLLFYIRRKRSNNDDEELLGIANMSDTFSYSELRAATGDFSPANKLGEGGFGPVYKGKLSDERDIAVKKLLVTSHQGKGQFVAEISIISAVQHRNLVRLYGCCIEGQNRLLVYEYLQNKSLDQALFGKNALSLDWPTRYTICLGAARGLAYLHEESKPRIVHRDIKASNILLDDELNPKISDFGLAKLYDDKKTHISTRVAGTIGYLAPEYAMRGHLTEKADVFGFGVVALEILCGRPNTDTSLDSERIYLLEWAWSLYESGRGLDLVDPKLDSFNEAEATKLLGIALLCTQASPMMRPSMSRVVVMLTGDAEVNTVTTKPSYLTDWQFSDLSSFVDDNGTGSGSLTSNTSLGQYHSSSNTSGVDTAPSPSPRPMLRDIGDEGR